MKLEELQYSIPLGWVDAFGQMLVDEINSVAEDSHVVEAKEKFGELRITIAIGNDDDYFNRNKAVDWDEIERITDKYKALSRNICIGCGKPDVHIVDTAWIYPCCKDCFEKHVSSAKKYEDVICDNGVMADSYKITRWSDEGYERVEFDISETAKKIRERWAERCADDKD